MAALSSGSEPAPRWASATKKSLPTAASRWKRSSASAPAPGPRPCRSTTTSTIGSRPKNSTRFSMLYNEPSPLETKVLTRRFGLPNSASIDTYLANDGYKAFEKALHMPWKDIIEEVKVSNLRGRGGAGFPTGMKWSFVPRDSPKPKYIVVNGDESEPGTCKDRLLIENDPHQLIEGVLIAGLSVDAHAGYVYIRGEYRYLIEVMENAIAEGYPASWLDKNLQGT